MPLTSPAYPPGPYRFINREYLNITYRTNSKRLRALVPEPLLPDDDTVKNTSSSACRIQLASVTTPGAARKICTDPVFWSCLAAKKRLASGSHRALGGRTHRREPTWMDGTAEPPAKPCPMLARPRDRGCRESAF